MHSFAPDVAHRVPNRTFINELYRNQSKLIERLGSNSQRTKLGQSNDLLLCEICCILTKCEVKVAGYWLSSFCVFMDRDGVDVHKFAKQERDQYLAILTEQAWSMQ